MRNLHYAGRGNNGDLWGNPGQLVFAPAAQAQQDSGIWPNFTGHISLGRDEVYFELAACCDGQ